LCSSLPFHVGNLSATLSISSCQAERGSLVTDKGILKYRMGRLVTWQGSG
jgi:hypothetical protein